MAPLKASWRDNFVKKDVGVSDMTLLSKVDNEQILENLRDRYFHNSIYTYIGHVLISVNPYQQLPLYDEVTLKAFIGKSKLEMPPHVFAIAENAYHNMVTYQEDQCVIISGESGAGKTEAAKRILQYIAHTSSSDNVTFSEIKDIILATNPLLEGFGNAKTLRNNNSSRFGKYLQIEFSEKGTPVGGQIINYLLEKGRVVKQTENERNFHIFYQFCAGASQAIKDEFGIGGPECYAYTADGKCLVAEGQNDVQLYEDTLSAMRIIGLSEHEIKEIHRILSIILWLGNIEFVEVGNDAQILDSQVSDTVAFLLNVEASRFGQVMTSRVMETLKGGRRGSIYNVPLNSVQAKAVRDALAKALYSRLFDWIVQRINISLAKRAPASRSFGVLDIYGFEIFESNSFEQLCINYVNEKLQQIFIELTLKSEQEEYVQERIQWTPIKFFDNKIVCDLIESKRPPGIISIMNDAIATAHADSDGADRSFSQRLGSCSTNPYLGAHGENSFVVKHYAGDVTYNVSGMTEKNKDQLQKDLLELVKASHNEFLHSLFPEQINPDAKGRPSTAGDKIRNSAADLVSTLMKCQPSYIRCIKPNENKKANEYDGPLVMHQIKYLGLLENIRVRRSGFAFRQTYQAFLERFFLLSRKTSYAGEFIWKGDAKEGVNCILKDCFISKELFQFGTSKVFIRFPETLWALEHLRERYWHTMAQVIQRSYRNYIRYKEECAIRIQRTYRKWCAIKEYIFLRDNGHLMLASRKERRRFSLVSMRRFMGDYLGINQGGYKDISALCGRALEIGVELSVIIQFLTPRQFRSSLPLPRIMIMTKRDIFIISLQKPYEIIRQVSIGEVERISLSNLQDDWMVVHCKSPLPDLVFSCPLKTEISTRLAALLGFSSDKINIAQKIDYVNHHKKAQCLTFLKEYAVGHHGIYQSRVIKVSEGQPSNSVSNPPCKRNERAARPITKGKLLRKGGPITTEETSLVKPYSQPLPIPPTSELNSKSKSPVIKMKALYDFTAQQSSEISIVAGQVFELVEKDSGGWTVIRSNGIEGYAPTTYLEEIEDIILESPMRPAIPVKRVSHKKEPTPIKENIKATALKTSKIPKPLPSATSKFFIPTPESTGATTPMEEAALPSTTVNSSKGNFVNFRNQLEARLAQQETTLSSSSSPEESSTKPKGRYIPAGAVAILPGMPGFSGTSSLPSRQSPSEERNLKPQPKSRRPLPPPPS